LLFVCRLSRALDVSSDRSLTVMNSHFLLMAKYNAWANARLYKMASNLPDELYRKKM